jgi:DNA polymerase-4
MFFDTLAEPSEVEAHLRLVAESLAIELRSRNRLAETVMLELRGLGSAALSPDSSSEAPHPSIWRLKRPMNQASDIFFALRRLLPSQIKQGMEVTGVCVTLSDLTVGEGLQLSLLGSSERKRRLDGLVETVRDRFGSGSLIYASTLAASGRERAFARAITGV